MSNGQNQTRDRRPKSGRRAPPRPTTAKQSPAGLVISVALHAGLLAATFYTWSRMVQMPPESHAIPVELVIAQQTNVRAEAPPPEEKPIVDKVAMPEPQLPAFLDAEPAPIPPIPQIRIIKPKTDLDQPDQPKSKKQMIQDADAVLNKILAQAKTPKDAKTSDRIIQGAGNQTLATADLVDAIKGQIYRCWSPPAGAPNASDLVVDFDLQLNPDGTVMGRPQLSGSSAAAMGNPYTRAAAEAASRAIYQCAPYKLPATRYSEWKEINPLRFDPREMMGQ
jgi:hypothetical protein